MVWLLANWKLVISLGGILMLAGWGTLEHHWRVGLETQIAEAKLKAAQDALQASKDAQAKSDELIIRQAAIFAENAHTTNTVTEKIIQVPVSTACAKSEAIQMAIDGVTTLYDRNQKQNTRAAIGRVVDPRAK